VAGPQRQEALQHDRMRAMSGRSHQRQGRLSLGQSCLAGGLKFPRQYPAVCGRPSPLPHGHGPVGEAPSSMSRPDRLTASLTRN
jgi:hypothetical protein